MTEVLVRHHATFQAMVESKMAAVGYAGLVLYYKGHSPQFSAHVYCGPTVAHPSYYWALADTSFKNVKTHVF